MDYDHACRTLRETDAVLSGLIERIGPCGLADLPEREPFETLVRSISSQQLSTRAAATIFNRFCDLFPPTHLPDPVRLQAIDDAALRTVGFSRPKIAYIRDLAARISDGRLDLETLVTLPDEDAIAALVNVKGIGRWTAEIFLMFNLRRPDLFPADDLGLMKAVHSAYRMRKRPSPQRLRVVSARWKPYRSVAAWYLWKSLSLPKTSPVTVATR